MIDHHVDRRDQIFGDAALQELAIEPHVVGVADHHDLGAGVADLGEAVERADQLVERQPASRPGSGSASARSGRTRRPRSMPPVCTFTCARAIRRSVAAVSIVPAISGVSQNAWMVMRGIGPRLRRAGRRLVPLRRSCQRRGWSWLNQPPMSLVDQHDVRLACLRPAPYLVMTLARRAPLAGAIGCGRRRSAGLATIAARFCCAAQPKLW